MSPGPDRDLAQRLQRVDEHVHAVVQSRRATDPTADDPFRGLYISDDDVDRVTATVPRWDYLRPAAEGHEPPALDDEAAGRLSRLAEEAGLTDLDTELLLIALAPDLDSRYEKLYGYLNDDVSRRRASIGLALELAGASALSADDRHRLSALGPLASKGLVLIEDLDRPFLTRSLRVPDRVAAHLLGDDNPDDELLPLLREPHAYTTPLSQSLTRALSDGVTPIHLREGEPGTGWACAAAALDGCGRRSLVVDLEGLSRLADPVGLATAVGREALLRGAGVIIGPVEVLAHTSLEAVDRLCRFGVLLLLVGSTGWDPRWSPHTVLSVAPPPLGANDRAFLLRESLADLGTSVANEAIGSHLSFGPGQVHRAARVALAASRMHGGSLNADDLRQGIRAQNSAGLEHLARRVQPEVGWDDLVLTPAVSQALHELAARARHRDAVLVDWKMRPGGGRGRGIIALFAGDSGTGKTMSAEVIASDLGLDLYTVNLATLVDKYIGETEKNLERIFTEAAGVNAVLFFDEADAIFGKRSEVRDAHDRYANVESAYLLQRLETFDGLAILATNLRANIDDAFTRRLDAIIDFPPPTAELRAELWRQCLSPPLPVAPDIDIDFCAQSFELTGGNIRSASISAAYIAAETEQPITMADLVTAVGQEYRKLGRLVHEREFGDYLTLLASRGVTGRRPDGAEKGT